MKVTAYLKNETNELVHSLMEELYVTFTARKIMSFQVPRKKFVLALSLTVLHQKDLE